MKKLDSKTLTTAAVILRLIFVFSIFISFFSSHAAVFKEIVLKDASVFTGEVIEVYKDRWFFERDSPKVDEYILLFESGVIPKFHLKKMDEIIFSKVTAFKPSEYRKLLKNRGISLDQDLVRNQYVITGNYGHHKFEKMFGNFAWDIGLIGPNGMLYKNDGKNLEDYFVYSKQVFSPLSGTVVGAVTDQIDNQPDPSFLADLSNLQNNYLTIKIDSDFYLSIVHFKKDSVPFRIGDIVKKGDFLGLVGNSGVSYTPHLHYTLYIYIKGLNRFISVPSQN